jgi:hypothetical protein
MQKLLIFSLITIALLTGCACHPECRKNENKNENISIDDAKYVLIKEDVHEFAGNYPTNDKIINKYFKLQQNQKPVFTPLGSKECVIIYLTDYTNTPYEKMEAQIVISKNHLPKNSLNIKGFKNLDVEWIDEDVLKIESWPGTSVQLIELINTENGHILYRSATGIYPQTAFRNN